MNIESGIEYDDNIPLADYDEYMKKNPNLERVYHGKAPALAGDHLMGVGPKTDTNFNDMMGNIASKHPDSPMADKYGSRKSTKRLQAENIYKKHKARK
tara:strand:+ start:119 stop:412 length:294 start_codon:yes stop_codon:yes gene_type:complete